MMKAAYLLCFKGNQPGVGGIKEPDAVDAIAADNAGNNCHGDKSEQQFSLQGHITKPRHLPPSRMGDLK